MQIQTSVQMKQNLWVVVLTIALWEFVSLEGEAFAFQKLLNLFEEESPRISLVKGERYVRHDDTSEGEFPWRRVETIERTVYHFWPRWLARISHFFQNSRGDWSFSGGHDLYLDTLKIAIMVAHGPKSCGLIILLLQFVRASSSGSTAHGAACQVVTRIIDCASCTHARMPFVCTLILHMCVLSP